jgi:ACS family sodium-dependent inorganic phosphate cotransporter-like MFS transporter 9
MYLFSGFLGVYLAGYILDITGSWMAVFNATAVINLFGITIFFVFGSATPIV